MIHTTLPGTLQWGRSGGSPARSKQVCVIISYYEWKPGCQKTWWIWDHLGYPATVILRRTIKGHTHILSAVHRTSICLTPDTFHSNSASCPMCAARLLENLHLSLSAKSQIGVLGRSQSSVYTHINRVWTKIGKHAIIAIYCIRQKTDCRNSWNPIQLLKPLSAGVILFCAPDLYPF